MIKKSHKNVPKKRRSRDVNHVSEKILVRYEYHSYAAAALEALGGVAVSIEGQGLRYR